MVEEGQPSETTSVTLDVVGVTGSYTTAMIAETPAGDGPWWSAVPQHSLLTLQGYPVSKHIREPRIFVFPVSGLEVSDNALQMAGSLQTLLQNRQPGEKLPISAQRRYPGDACPGQIS